MAYYTNLVTQKSWKLLQKLKNEFDFILIGGWAVFLYTKTLKSKDIDLVLEWESLAKIRQKWEVFKNERLKKYEAHVEEVEIDIYVPFYSNPGVAAEEIKKWTQSLEGFTLPKKEILLISRVSHLSNS